MVKLTQPARATVEGAGVRLVRTIGCPGLSYVDPFLLLDEFKSDDPSDYLAGFPWHPHRGIETVTYMIRGSVEHGDSIGNSGTVGPGDAQWMTAGRGIIHQEMPRPDDGGRMWGTQLWVNLPASAKMRLPRYQDIRAADIAEAALDGGGTVRVVCGTFAGVTGPVTDIDADPLYMDVRLPSAGHLTVDTPAGYSAFCYCLEGSAIFDPAGRRPTGPSTIVVYGTGDRVEVQSGEQGVRFLFASGRVLGEPIARGGPFVMNTLEEIEQAWREYREGRFLG